MIKFNDMLKESEVTFLKQTLLKIKGDDFFSPEVQAMSYVLLADIAMKNFTVL